MPLLSGLNSTTNNINLSSRWINGEANLDSVSPFDYNYSTPQNATFTLSNTSCCSYAPYFSDYGRDGVAFKSYNENKAYIYNEDNSFSLETITALSNTSIIYYGNMQNVNVFQGGYDGVMFVGTNNKVSGWDVEYKEIQEIIPADNMTFNGSKGCVVCTYNHDSLTSVGQYLWAIYKDEGNYVSCISPQDDYTWDGMNTQQNSSVFKLDANEEIVGTPFYDQQQDRVSGNFKKKTIYILTKRPTTQTFRVLKGVIDVGLSTFSVSQACEFSVPTLNLMSNIQLVTFSSDPVIGIVFNAVIGNKLQWFEITSIIRSSTRVLNEPIVNIGGNTLVVFNNQRYAKYGTETYYTGGIINTLGTSPLNEFNYGSATLSYFFANKYFNNNKMLIIYCKKNDKIYLATKPSNDYYLWSFTKKFYYMSVTKKSLTYSTEIYIYKVPSDCIISVDRNIVLGVEFATPSN